MKRGILVLSVRRLARHNNVWRPGLAQRTAENELDKVTNKADDGQHERCRHHGMQAIADTLIRKILVHFHSPMHEIAISATSTD
jgi:hypothetical protein